MSRRWEQMGFSKWAIYLLILPFPFLYRCDQYVLLPETNLACVPNLARMGQMIIVDDVFLDEQILLTWLPVDSPPSSNSGNVSAAAAAVQLSKSLSSLVACPGLSVHPTGRFVRKSLMEGKVYFWLLHAKATLICPTDGRDVTDYAVHIDQWVEPSMLVGTGSNHQNRFYPTSSSLRNPVAVSNTMPDNSLHLNCSTGIHYVSTDIHGYVRKLRVKWQLNGALAELNSSTTNYSDFGMTIRITSRMLFQGNFSSDRERKLCEFFSGFWCDSVSPTLNLTAPVRELKKPGCIQAMMRCDSHPDCDLPSIVASTLDPIPILSRDEMNCDVIYDLLYYANRSQHSANSTVADVWTSRLPFIVLAPVPLVLFCALVRICTQKRRLYITEDEYAPNPPQADPLMFEPKSQIHNTTAAWSDKINVIRAKTRRWVPKYGRIYTSATALSSVTEANEDEHDLSTAHETSTEMDVITVKTTNNNGIPSPMDSCQPPYLVVERPISDRRSYLCWSGTVEPTSSSSSSSPSFSSSSSSSPSSLCSRRSSSSCSNNSTPRTFELRDIITHSQSYGDLQYSPKTATTHRQDNSAENLVDHGGSCSSDVQFQNNHFTTEGQADLQKRCLECSYPHTQSDRSPQSYSEKDPLFEDRTITVEAVVNWHTEDIDPLDADS